MDWFVLLAAHCRRFSAGFFERTRMNSDKMMSITFNAAPARWVGCKCVGRFWPSAFLSSLGGLRLQETPIPPLPGEDWVLCRTLLGGICGTDIGMIFMRQLPSSMFRNITSMPIMMGHENVARIVRAGKDVKDFQADQKIVVDPPLACAARKITPPCPACSEGKPSTCWNFDRGTIPPALGLGYNNFTGGSWSNYFVAHVSQLHAMPETIPDNEAILVDPLACSLHAVLRDLPSPNEKILVFGAGIISLGIIQFLRTLNIPLKIVATVRHPFQADLARRCGADQTIYWQKDQIGQAMEEMARITGGRQCTGPFKLRYLQGGFDRLFDCTGKVSGLVDSQRLVRSCGTIIIAGTPQLGLIDMTCFWFRELKVLGTTGRAFGALPGETVVRHSYEHVISFLEQKRIDVSYFPTRFYRQAEYLQAFRDLQTRGRNAIVKAVFDFR
jgi:threonine dehydrogenase-like Zn-dependent dehydrogenase